MKEIKEDTEDGKTHHTQRSIELILWKCSFCQEGFTDSIRSPSKSLWYSLYNRKNLFQIHMEP